MMKHDTSNERTNRLHISARTHSLPSDWRLGNPYQSLLAAGLAEAKWHVVFGDYPGGLMPLQKILEGNRLVEAIHLHWIAPYIEQVLWTRSWSRFYVKAALLMLDVLLCRLKGKRVVWTVHNRLAHESPNPSRERIVRRLLANVVSHTIFHSDGARRVFRDEIGRFPLIRSSVVPHGNYIGFYPKSAELAAQLAKRLKVKRSDKVVLFFGAVRLYKGIPRLLRVFRQVTNSELRLIIAGSPFDEELRTAIEKASKEDRRIRPYLNFIPEEEVAPLHSLADLLVIPFEKTLTSGSVLLAMSLGQAVALPSSARVLDVPSSEGALYFDSDDELRTIFDTIDHARTREMGSINLALAKTLDWSRIGSMIGGIYNG